MKIFVIHYNKLIERKAHILKLFRLHKITNYEFIEIDRDELANHDTSMFEEGYNKAQIAITLSHMYAYRQIAAKYDHALIFEDDIVLDPFFEKKFKKIIAQLSDNYDMCFIGSGSGLHIEANKIVKDKYVYRKCLEETSWGGGGATRCTDSYIMSKKCAVAICKYFDNLPYKINQAVDWWLNTVARDNNLRVYWAEPTIVTQGTISGLFESSH
jgi:GR25 family glycosyltransferase involved in LPS biosynthesis